MKSDLSVRAGRGGFALICVRVDTNKSAAEADLVTLEFVLRLLQRHCARHMATSRVKHHSFNAFFVLSTSLSRALPNISRGRRLSPQCSEGGEREAWHGRQEREGLDAQIHRTEDGIWDQPVCAALTTDTVIHDASNMTAKSPRREPSLFACTSTKPGCPS